MHKTYCQLNPNETVLNTLFYVQIQLDFNIKHVFYFPQTVAIVALF